MPLQPAAVIEDNGKQGEKDDGAREADARHR